MYCFEIDAFVVVCSAPGVHQLLYDCDESLSHARIYL
jgi:hypothetical protein